VYGRLRIQVSATMCRPGHLGLYAAVSRCRHTAGLEFTGDVHLLKPAVLRSAWEHWLRPVPRPVPSPAASAAAASVTAALGWAEAPARRRVRTGKRSAESALPQPAAAKGARTSASPAPPRAAEFPAGAPSLSPAAGQGLSAGCVAAGPEVPAQGRAPPPSMLSAIKSTALRQAVAAVELAAPPARALPQMAQQAPPRPFARPSAVVAVASAPPIAAAAAERTPVARAQAAAAAAAAGAALAWDYVRAAACLAALPDPDAP
jgi:hypothetical protein